MAQWEFANDRPMYSNGFKEPAPKWDSLANKYAWVVEELEKHFPKVLSKLFDYGNTFSVAVENGLSGPGRKGIGYRLEYSYVDANKPHVGYWEVDEWGDKTWNWIVASWKRSSLNEMPNKEALLREIILKMKDYIENEEIKQDKP